MAHGFLASSRNALLFAGMVIACAAIAATSLGSRFTPQPDNAASAEQSNGPVGQNEREAPSKVQDASADADADADPGADGADSVFGEFDGFADEADLMDNTSGFDPTPSENLIVTTDVEPSSSAAETSGISESRQPSGRTAPRLLTKSEASKKPPIKGSRRIVPRSKEPRQFEKLDSIKP